MKLTTTLLLMTASILLAAEKPNIILILADDLGSGDVSSYNPQSKINTPNIDYLVSEGIKFTDGHSNSSVCTPTRYGVSYHSHLQGDLNQTEAIKEATIHHSVNGTFAIRSGKWKLILSSRSGGRTRSKAKTKTKTKGQLFDMENDISEKTNLYAQHPEIVEKLTKMLAAIKAKKH